MTLSLQDAIAKSIDTLTHFSIPLYQNVRGQPSLHASCFFVKHKTEHFLVTAAHVLDTAFSDSLYFYRTESEPVHLSGKAIRSGAALSRGDDKIDIGVVRVSDSISPPFPDVEKVAMDVSYLQPNRVPRDGREYVIIGFPSSKSRVNNFENTVLAAPYAYRSASIPTSEYSDHGVSPETHVVLPLNLRKGFGADGEHVHFPKPQGMSGAPITVLIEDDSESRVFPVVAVGIEYRKKQRVLIGTDVRYVISAIRESYGGR